MCLARVTKEFSRDDHVSGFGWKVFNKGNCGTGSRVANPYSVVGSRTLFGECKGATSTEREVGKWLHERKFRSPFSKSLRVYIGNSRRSYPIGWHIWASRMGAEEWAGCSENKIIMRVKYRDARVKGTQNLRTAIVAKERIVIPDK